MLLSKIQTYTDTYKGNFMSSRCCLLRMAVEKMRVDDFFRNCELYFWNGYFSESIKLIVCDKEDDGEDQEDYLCTGDIDLVPLSKNKIAL